MSTFVTVGNARQPFDRLLKAVAAVTGVLPPPIVVQHGVSRVVHPNWEVHDFLHMCAFQERVADSELLIMHGGAGSIIHALQAGRTPLVMPRRVAYGEHIDDHQVELARALAENGDVVLVMESGDLGQAIGATAQTTRSPRARTVPALVEHLATLLGNWSGGKPRST